MMDSDAIVALLEARRFDEATAALQERLTHDENDLEALFLFGSLANGAEGYAAAARMIDRALQLAPGAPPILAIRAYIALAVGDTGKAVTCLEQAFQAAPQDGALARKLWREWQLRGDTRASILLGNLIASASDDAGMLHDLAHDVLSLGQVDRAIALLRQSLLLRARPAVWGDLACLTGEIRGLMAALPPEDIALAESLLAADSFSPVANPALTVFVTTNLTKKLVVNAAKAPPSDRLIRETLESFVRVMQPPAGTRMVVIYDMPCDVTDADHLPYLTALEKLADDFGATLRCRHASGLKANYLAEMADIDTPYAMLLEHDWLFSAACPTLAQMIDVLQHNSTVHLLRLNKRANVALRDDIHLWRATNINAPLLKTLNYSNNPHVLRVAKFQRDFLPVILGLDTHDTINGGAGGLEESVRDHIAGLARRFGPLLAQRWAGTCLWGAENDPARLTHTGI